MKNSRLRLTDMEYIVLQMLVAESKMYGLDMVKKSNGSLKRGTVYVTLQRMEDKGLVSSEKEEIDSGSTIPRRFYKPTPAGILSLRAIEQISIAMNGNPVPV
jgi:PadR family transcriptional regulator PadR